MLSLARMTFTCLGHVTIGQLLPFLLFNLRSASSWLRSRYFGLHQVSAWTAHHSQAAVANIGKYARTWRVRKKAPHKCATLSDR